MKCPKCGAWMIIDEWGGWKWSCFNCDHIGRDATDAEIKKQEDETN